MVFGGKLVKCQEIGMTKIKKMKKNELFSKDFEAYSLHNYTVENLDNFDVLGKSSKCAQAFKVKNKEIYGVLFHPEVRNQDVILNFISS